MMILELWIFVAGIAVGAALTMLWSLFWMAWVAEYLDDWLTEHERRH